MKAWLRVVLGAALLSAAGCTLTLDPESVDRPVEDQPPRAVGACVEAASGTRVCGGAVGSGGAASRAGGHRVEAGRAVSTGLHEVSNTRHRIVEGAVAP